MFLFFNIFFIVIAACLVIGSLLPLVDYPHWFIRTWDFPRVQIILFTWATAVGYALTQFIGSGALDAGVAAMGAVALGVTIWQSLQIAPYTPLVSPQVKAWNRQLSGPSTDESHLRLVMTNVQQENRQIELWKDVMTRAEPDIMIVAEVNADWAAALNDLRSTHPYQVCQPQENCYGLAIASRLPITEQKIRFLVQDDIPSIDTLVELPSGQQVRVVGVHPRPPEPVRDTNSTARDGELSLWGKELVGESRPVVIGGDLNDVAWSRSTRLFLRVSGLLDPRRGRGFYNSFHARHWWMRFPLDHVFHSTDFSLRRLARLDNVGSDHFPILVDLQYEPREQNDHDRLDKKQGDSEEAEEKVERAEESSEAQSEIETPREAPAASR